MVHISNLVTGLATISLINSTFAHKEVNHNDAKIKRKLETLDTVAGYAKRSLGGCAETMEARALKERAVSRRAAIAQDLQPFFHRRTLADLERFELINHQQNNTSFSLQTDESTIFGANTSGILTPEQIIGPYFVAGEYIRSNVTEGQAGIPMHLEMQFVDIETGIEAEGTLQNMYLRGVQASDKEGVVQFDTIVPGHYLGRATHEHIVVTANATILPNGTYAGRTVNHIGQLYFDESLRAAVEQKAPYNTNSIAVTSNDEDMWAITSADANYDPFPEYIMLGNSLDDGLLMWISIGINTTANVTDEEIVAAYWEEDGGHTNPNANFGGGGPPGGNGTGNSTMPANATLTGAPLVTATTSGGRRSILDGFIMALMFSLIAIFV